MEMEEAEAAAAAAVQHLPKAIVRRVVKEKLSQLSEEGDINVNKDALVAFTEGARIFIHYLSATANDICSEARRQIVNAEDVLKALHEIDFSEFVQPLQSSLEVYREIHTGKREAAAGKESESNKKRTKSADESTPNNNNAADESNPKEKKKKKAANGTEGNSKKKLSNGKESDSKKKNMVNGTAAAKKASKK